MKTQIIIYFHILISIVAYSQTNTLNDVLTKYKDDKALKHASYSYCVLDAKTGQLISEYNSEMSLVPASTLKIMTTSVALGILGGNYRYETKLVYTGVFDSITGVLKGNLVIIGSGDPTLNSAYFTKTDTLPVVETWAFILKKKGIKRIDGSIVVDISCFDNDISSNWIWGDIGNYFGAGANGLSYNDNKYSVFFTTGAVGEKAVIKKMSPNIEGLSVKSDVIAEGTEDNAYIYGDPYGYTKTIKGTIPPNKSNYEVEGALPNPGKQCALELLKALEKLNISVKEKQPILNEEWAKYTNGNSNLIYSHKSPPLSKIIYYTNLKSNNHYTESLLKTLGLNYTKKQGTTYRGIEAVLNFWKNRGINTEGTHMVDGSGLSRANAISSKTQATVLSKIYRDSFVYSVFNASLPVAGLNGSMANLCNGTFAEKNMRAKTGYITRARGYCGYVKTKTGKELSFSILFNNYDCSPKEMKEKIEWFLVALPDL